MKQVLGVILLSREPDLLGELTRRRCLAALPFGGRHRLIDFALSSMVRAGICGVAVLAHTKYKALMAHLGSGKEWDLHGKRGGLWIIPPETEGRTGFPHGELRHVYDQRDLFWRSAQEYVLVTRGHMVANVDFGRMLRLHLETGADVTMLYGEAQGQEHAFCRRVHVEPDGRITRMQLRPGKAALIRERSASAAANAIVADGSPLSLEMYLMKKDLLLDFARSAAARQGGSLGEAIARNIGRLTVAGMAHRGFLGVVNTVPGYYAHSMRLLQPEIWRDLFQRPGPVYTKLQDEAPAKYGSGAQVQHALVANGCVIEGQVENSILFRGVKVERGACVRDSIVLPGCVVRANAQVSRAILDEETIVEQEQVLAGERLDPLVVAPRSPLGREAALWPGHVLPV